MSEVEQARCGVCSSTPRDTARKIGCDARRLAFYKGAARMPDEIECGLSPWYWAAIPVASGVYTALVHWVATW